MSDLAASTIDWGAPCADEDEAWWQRGAAFAALASQPAPPMLVAGLLPGDGITLPHGVTLPHGDPRALKSWSVLDLAVSLALGAPALSTLRTSPPVVSPEILAGPRTKLGRYV